MSKSTFDGRGPFVTKTCTNYAFPLFIRNVMSIRWKQQQQQQNEAMNGQIIDIRVHSGIERCIVV